MGVNYYLFEPSDKVAKYDGTFWYKRDKEAHEWVSDNSLARRFYDAACGVERIEYDEEREEVVSVLKGLVGDTETR